MQVYGIIRSSGISWEEATLRRKAMPLLMDWDATRPHTRVTAHHYPLRCCLTRPCVMTHFPLTDHIIACRCPGCCPPLSVLSLEPSVGCRPLLAQTGAFKVGPPAAA